MSTPAFTAPASLSARAFSGPSVAQPTTSLSPSTPTMALSRRSALGAALTAAGAALLPAAAFAKGGESAKISIFGMGSASSPFVAGIKTSGTVQYKRFSDDELAYFKSIVDASGERFAQTKASIDIKNWEDIRSLIRLETTLLRQTMVSVMDSLDGDRAKDSQKVFQAFKKDINDLDYACVTKNQDKAQKAYKATVKSFYQWREVANI